MAPKVVPVGDGLAVPCKSCGTYVMQVLMPPLRFNFEETIVCQACGRDNSVRPPLSYRWAYGWARARKRRLALGWWWWLRYAPWKCWLMPYELGPQ